MATAPQAAGTPASAPGSNSAPLQQALKQQAYEFGKREGDGALARSDFGDWVTSRAKDGDCSVDGSAELWADFQRGANERPDAELGGVMIDSKEMAQRASDLKHYITLGANAHLDGPELLANARLVLKNMRDSGTAKGLRTWDVMLVWLRKQNASPERALSDQEIEDLFRERAKRATDELDRLTSAKNTLAKQQTIYDEEKQHENEERERAEAAGETYEGPSEDEDDDTRSARVSRALELIEGCIADLGGTRKEQRKAARKAERERKAAEKQAAKDARAAV